MTNISPPSKVVLAYSGGIDSFTVALMLRRMGCDVHGVFVGQGSEVTQKAAEQLAKELEMTFVPIDMSDVYQKLKTPGVHYIPGFKVFYYTAVMAYAEKIGTPFVYTGEVRANLNVNRPQADPDTRREAALFGQKVVTEMSTSFRNKLAALWAEGYYPEEMDYYWCQFVDPLIGTNKPERLRLVRALYGGELLKYTITCKNAAVIDSTPEEELLEKGPRHCGEDTCYFCTQRKQVFAEAGIEDPTNYARHEG
jgi:7-cyano-7-deazaguanine synthase in queuosine biosynthesis